MNTNNKRIYLALLAAALVGTASCSKVSPLDVDDEAQAALLERDKKKWAEEAETLAKNRADSAAISEENKRLREIYLADLRAYKKTKHPVMFGWFAYWNPTSPDKTFSLDQLPDSVDFISNWGQQWNLGSERIEQWNRLREKGTRMTAGWIVEGVGNGLQNAPEGGWSTDPFKAIEQYAQAIADSVKKYGYDGIDVDYEPSFSSPWKLSKHNKMHCGDWVDQTTGAPIDDWSKNPNRPIISCSPTENKQYENHFFTKLREYLPKGSLLNVNGSIDYLDPSVTSVFDYFVFQSYNNTASRWTSTADRVMSANKDITADQFIYTESFQNNPANANGFNRYVTYGQRYGGIGAFHINEDWLYSKYNNVRSVISTLNPPMDK
ncbi:MAG: glycoside hydrolase family 18 [Porphyromonas sp.]|nr:glycoside hydrolase family 18 [Porphyromonas sp.]